jgi:hypothetical protein
MTTVRILRDLWSHRLYVAGVCVLALLAGFSVMYKLPAFQSRHHEVGVATVHILIDTPSSQVVEVAPKGSDTLGTRANLLASLMIDGVVKSSIAHRAGLQPNQLAGVTDAATGPSSASGPTSQAAPSGSNAYVLTTQVLINSAGIELPIIEADAQAPTGAGAAKLANAAVAGLQDYVNSKAALQRIPDANRLQVSSLGSPQAITAQRGPSNLLAMLAFIFVLIFGCGCILGVLALVRGWRAAAVREEIGDEEILDWDVAPAKPDVPFLDEVSLLDWDDRLVPDEHFADGLWAGPGSAQPAESAGGD